MPQHITFEANPGKLQGMVDNAINRALINQSSVLSNTIFNAVARTFKEGQVLGILNVTTKIRPSFLILITAPKMPNLSLMPLKPSCHPQHDMRDTVLKYVIALLNK